MDIKHGYGAYTNGCRCEVCRAGKAAYTRERRRRANSQARLVATRPVPANVIEVRHVVDGITHGRFGYEERGCRCQQCVDARRKHWRDSERRRDRPRPPAHPPAPRPTPVREIVHAIAAEQPDRLWRAHDLLPELERRGWTTNNPSRLRAARLALVDAVKAGLMYRRDVGLYGYVDRDL